MFKTIVREETLATQVTGQVESLIVESQLQPGDHLPAERELASQFGVSRTVIREAVRSLVAKGLLEVKPGSGTIVSIPSAHSVSQTMTLFLRGGQPELDYKKVIEVRRLLEVEIAGLAAERRTAKDLTTLETILEDSTGIYERRERFIDWDVAFHAALAAATQNDLFVLLLDSVVATMRKVRELGFDVPSSPVKALKHHRRIFEQVRKGDGSAARNAMRDHLVEAEDTMRRAIELRAGPRPRQNGRHR